MYPNLKDMKMFKEILKGILFGLIILMFIIFTSCKKQVIYPTDQLPANVPTATGFGGVSKWGTFKLIGSQKQFKQQSIFYTDADTSSLRLSGSLYPIEDIIKNSTTWTFIAPSAGQNEGKFILNGDTSLHFIVNYTGQYSTIMNDSEDPYHAQGTNISFSGVSVIGNGYTASDSIVSITINNGYFDNNHNEYTNVLLFKKQ